VVGEEGWWVKLIPLRRFEVAAPKTGALRESGAQEKADG
jgi:hypothetical protein